MPAAHFEIWGRVVFTVLLGHLFFPNNRLSVIKLTRPTAAVLKSKWSYFCAVYSVGFELIGSLLCC